MTKHSACDIGSIQYTEMLQTTEGICKTLDGGNRWFRRTYGLMDAPIKDFLLLLRSNALVLEEEIEECGL